MPSLVPVEVDFTATNVCDPDPVTVKKNQNNGVKWTCMNDGYTFTGVKIDSVTYTPSSSSTGEFKDVEISTNNSKSVMTITDTVSDTNDHDYDLVYTDPQGVSHVYDPTIRHRN